LAVLVILAVGCHLSCNSGEEKTTARDETAKNAPDLQRRTSVVAVPEKPTPFTLDLGAGVKMEFVLIPAGSFLMGSEKGGNDEKPVHKVTIAKPFYLGKYEVTQEQWQVVMGSNPSRFKGPKNPVEMVSWNGCQEFLKKINEKFPGIGSRLPSEAEWEYACRAGSTTEYCFGDGETGLGDYAWYVTNSGRWSFTNSGRETHPVGEKKPNAWGLYDMHGNVAEWCQDWYHDSYSGAPRDGSAWESPAGSTRVIRGGLWNYYALSCRSANRYRYHPDSRYYGIGFRFMRTQK
jgi:formylglycine-generating enzyme required for sulfatase activity